jgi:hypothetical protein
MYTFLLFNIIFLLMIFCRRALSNMFELLLPGGELLVVFLASNPLFSVYEKLSEDSAWSKYMTVCENKLFKQ